ncbi:MAG: hypothetical protein K1000chlam4_00196, partial [Chlamydiae bacterium]|nr:hypothetical protein [Chlamydiota bacterium]
KKVGRNDPCPCGSGKKYKKCCKHRLGPKRKFSASVLSGGGSNVGGLQGKATKISTDFFKKPPEPKKEEPPRKAEDDEPKHPPEADEPM